MRSSRVLITALIGINAFVFLMWQVGDVEPLMQNFVVSWTAAFTDLRLWTLVTTVFSHENTWHFALNMMVLNSFGNLLASVLGNGRFLRFYLVAGVIGSVVHCAVSKYVLGAPQLGAVGASGALNGMVMLFALMFPKEKILLFGLVPLPALIGSLAFVGFDVWGVYAQYGGGGFELGHGAHLGGALAGALYYATVIRRRWVRRQM